MGGPAGPARLAIFGPQNRDFSPLTRAFVWGGYISGVRLIGTPPMGEWPSGHAPWEPGNKAALKHGAYSEDVISAKAREVHSALLDVAPYLAEPKFLPAVERYLSAAAREALLHGHVVSVSEAKGPGAVPSRMWEQATAAARLAAKLGSDLGLDPIGHARIRSLSVTAEAAEATLGELMAEGRRTTGWAALHGPESGGESE